MSQKQRKIQSTQQVSRLNSLLPKRCMNMVRPSFLDRSGKEKSVSEKTTTKSNYIQDYLETIIKDVVGGLVLMADGSVVGIQEVLPLNYYQRPVSERDDIIENFGSMFKSGPNFIHLKMFTSKADVNKLINYINNVNLDEVKPEVLNEIPEYINHIRSLQQADSVHRRYFIIWEYEGDSFGKKSIDINEIYRSMYETRMYIKDRIEQDVGNLTLDPLSVEDNNWFTCELLYQIFNPKSSITEPFIARVDRLTRDEKTFNSTINKKKKPSYSTIDYIAPRGLTNKKNYIIVDGQYETYLVLRDVGHPLNVYGGWTNLLSHGIGYDIDILIRKLPHEVVTNYLTYNNRLTRTYADLNVNKSEVFNDVMNRLQNKTYIQEMLKNANEDLWNVMIIMTIRADSYKNMMYRRNKLAKALSKNSMYTDDSFLTAMEYYKMTLPFNYVYGSLFRKYSRNYLTNSLSSLYNMTGNELFDDTGLCIGSEASNGSLVSFNPFNTKLYSNANIAIFGVPGAGKTFLECMFSRRARLSGRRVFLVLPVKGHEYFGMVKSVGGTFVKLHPGSDNCINMMQIRPVLKLNPDFIEDEDYKETSLLAKKITLLETFIAALLGERVLSEDVISKLNSIITEVYKRFGITNDNDSIYRDANKTILKPMPIPADLYDAINRYEELQYIANALAPFVDGTFSNFNDQTNVDLTNKCIAFDIDARIVGEKFLPAIMILATDFCNDMIMQDDLSQDFLIVDEMWKALINDICAKQIQEIVKLIRAYGGSLVVATQEVDDCIDSINKYGKSILSNTAIKIILKIDKPQLRIISDYVDLSSADMHTLTHLPPKGQGMIFSAADRIRVNFTASEREIELFTTDINIKKEIQKKRKKKQNIAK